MKLIWLGTGLVYLFDDRCGVLVPLAFVAEFSDLGGFVDSLWFSARYPQRALHGDLPVAEGGVWENLRLFGFLELRERGGDAFDVDFRQFAVLLAEVPA